MESDSEHLWLAIDVGNSQIKVGLFTTSDQQADASPEPLPPETTDHTCLARCLSYHSLPLSASIPWEEICDDQHTVPRYHCVIVGSNQHGVDRIVSEWPDWLPQPVVIRSSESFPIEIEVDEPRRAGLDRLLNAVAANAVKKANEEVIIVSCGTATTVDLVSASGSFCGGAILPGFTLCARALNQYTEVLPLISMDELFDLPPSEDSHPAIGSNTQAAIMSGSFWGQIGAVRELINRMQKHQPNNVDNASQLKVLLTGGGSRLLVPYFPDAIHFPYLPLQGLILAAESNQHS